MTAGVLVTLVPSFQCSMYHRVQTNLLIQIVEKVFSKSEAVRLTRERLYINFFEAENRGMNRKT